ncbi:MAG: 1-(5-phosphoribosyl)-5-((5-phosphoribosylamino)methylideneamino)imidazole-4-carboxamide isomerase [Holophagaceae bacterium]|jgi:phosphoribosylformimino-5-aminoimidazole carboxamide ribotide isomerase|uniref:1-(5-phosphoribosyl)-5-((5-phosphoribosylamino)methylideneamino)imidazole-4-carboxamide isomerase n=1 Tax=Candidatus Geothrix odensensis TaxID=2954440 RepID=A0A936EZY5_9BACT|nr:1-(5-phosphoribosyl)-5-((5-phosphoribosylamino)methylideneamino)imidazole-4-carboxamide isomerase [Holophagaceae bacterium]MBK8571185.1 1-(5-phosphoribosyl)-5-((5-phosphoribosylamino)methylideneamino)imidazole-4-carboxamide isomerase [Candidatus Geothrix odensensis]
MQLIPSLDLMQGRLVRLRHGDPKQATFYDLEPEDWVGQLAEAGARRIHLVDLDGAFGRPLQGRFTGFPVRFPEIHFQLGGGLRDRGAIESVLDLGFDAVVGTLAVEQPASLKGLSGQRVIAALDLRGDRIVTRGWQAPSACASTDVFEALLTLGFHRALVTDVSRDGTLEGPGVEAAAWVAREGFLVQASGGVKELGDLLPLAKVPGVVGAISGKALMEGFIPLDDPRLRAALEGGA